MGQLPKVVPIVDHREDVRGAADGQESLRTATEEPTDLMLLPVLMPVNNRFDPCRPGCCEPQWMPA